MQAPEANERTQARLEELVVLGSTRAGAGVGDAADAAEGAVESSPLDWSEGGEELVDAARRHRLTGPLVAALGAGTVTLTDPQAGQAHRAHVDALAWCLRLEDRLCEVAEWLADVDIAEPRVIKGPAIAHLDDGDPSMRTFGDLDLLVRGDDLDRIIATLESKGATRPYAERRPGFDRRFAKSVTVTFPDGVEVDVHRTICDGVHAVRVPIDRLFERPERFSLAGVEFAALDPTARLLHAAYHAVLGSPEPDLRSCRDLVGYLSRTEGSISDVASEAARWGGTAVLHAAVASVGRLPGASLHGWTAWADAHPVSPKEQAIVAAQRRDGSSFGWSRLRAVTELPTWGNRLAYTRAVLVPSREHLATRGLTRASWWRPGQRG